jgi:predicted dinucleotide-binding enzyme
MKHVAVFGAGRIGRIHASNLAALPGVQLQAICDPSAEAASDLAQSLGAKVSTIEAVLADKQIDAVAICSPTVTHSDLITRAASAGKHIFCEKPVDLSVPRAQACADAVKAAPGEARAGICNAPEGDFLKKFGEVLKSSGRANWACRGRDFQKLAKEQRAQVLRNAKAAACP